MVGLLGSLGFMVQHASTLDSSEVGEFSEMALKSVERLHGEIEDILQYLQTPGIGKSEEGFPLAHLQDLIAQIGENLQITTVNVSTSDDLTQTWLPSSQQAIELILWEILENSKKFHPQNTPTVQVIVSQNGADAISIKIEDDGMALSPEQLSQMWMPYYQGEKYSTGEVKGMGLGLSTVASLVWEVNGSCRAYNRQDAKGLVVELTLPIVQSRSE
jgi:K+-sensing histidine kinase KdpD